MAAEFGELGRAGISVCYPRNGRRRRRNARLASDRLGRRLGSAENLCGYTGGTAV